MAGAIQVSADQLSIAPLSGKLKRRRLLEEMLSKHTFWPQHFSSSSARRRMNLQFNLPRAS